MPLVDRPALLQSRRRAARQPALFLQEEAASEVQERRALVNRPFTEIAIVSPWPNLWAKRFPGARIIPDDDVLDLAPASQDLVIHSLCLHWSNDPVGQLIQARRALKPDGLFLATLFGGRTLYELRAVLAEAETAQTGGLSPRVLPMADIRDLGALLQRAGFVLPVADSVTQTVTYRDVLSLMRDLRAMAENNAMEARLRRPTARGIFADAAARYSQVFGTDDGRIPATFETICLTAWAPGPNQPEPLRPGSATTRLAEALGTHETALGERATPNDD